MVPGLTSAEAKILSEPPTHIVAPWVDLLSSAIESEILPRLLAASLPPDGARPEPGHDRDASTFLSLIIADDMDSARAIAARMVQETGSRTALLNDLLTPAARLLGTMWEQDVCDFMTVTLGVYRLDQIMKETAAAGLGIWPLRGAAHRILLLPAPGEQHRFGASMVADTFREDGWNVHTGPALSKANLLRLVHDDWFDVIGLSVSADRWLKGLPATIRAVRAAACNPGAFFMVGGPAITHHAERTRFLGADATASDAQAALQQANLFMESAVTAGLHTSKTQLVDAG